MGLDNKHHKRRNMRIAILLILICCVLLLLTGNVFLIWIALIPPSILLTVFIRSVIESRITANANKIITYLEQDCNPALYVRAYEKYDKKFGKNKRLHWTIQCNLGYGYFYCGCPHQGIDILNQIIYQEDHVVEDSTMVIAHYNLCQIYLFLNKPDKVEFHLRELNYYLSVIDPDYKSKQLFHRLNKPIRSGLNVLDPNSSSYLKEELHSYQENFNTSAFELGRINAQYWIFKIYEKFGNIEQQAVCMKYIKDHGNQLFLTDLAGQWLKEH